MQELENKHDFFNMCKKVNEMIGRKKTKPPTRLLNDNSLPITTNEDLVIHCKNYIQNMFEDNRTSKTA